MDSSWPKLLLAAAFAVGLTAYAIVAYPESSPFDQARTVVRDEQEAFNEWSEKLGVRINAENLTDLRAEPMPDGTTRVYFEADEGPSGKRAVIYVRIRNKGGFYKLAGYGCVERQLGHAAKKEVLHAQGD